MCLHLSHQEAPQTQSREKHFLHYNKNHSLSRKGRKLPLNSGWYLWLQPSSSLCGPGKQGSSDGSFLVWMSSEEHLPLSLELLISLVLEWRGLGQHQPPTPWQALRASAPCLLNKQSFPISSRWKCPPGSIWPINCNWTICWFA